MVPNSHWNQCQCRTTSAGVPRPSTATVKRRAKQQPGLVPALWPTAARELPKKENRIRYR